MALLAAVLFCAVAVGPSGRSTQAALPAEVLAGSARAALAVEPAAGIEEAYKWIFQATRGGEHAAPSEEAARAWLESEWAGLGPPLPGEPLVVQLRPDGAVVRLNLRPFKAAGGDPVALLRAFLSSARSFEPDPGLFVAAWRAFGRGLPADGAGGMGAGEFEALDRSSEKAGWPARHHSRRYAEAVVPAYRVLTGNEADCLIGAGDGSR